jgi:16S rRNA (guanine527-N7)-methyltransferase
MIKENVPWQTLLNEKEYNDRLLEWNKKINLVSRRKNDIHDLIEDSKLFFEKIDFQKGVKILDLGTGGGIPGIIIKIYHPEIQLTLLDSIQKKINAVKDIIKKMGMKDVEIICSLAEDITKNTKYLNAFDYVAARSVASLQDIAKWSKDLLKPRGKLITVKGGDISGEIYKTRRLNYVKNIEVTKKEERLIVVVEYH